MDRIDFKILLDIREELFNIKIILAVLLFITVIEFFIGLLFKL